MSSSAKRIAIYALDASLRSTASMGIYQFTRNLLEALCKSPAPDGLLFEVWVSEENKEDLLTEPLPPWMSLRIAKGGYGRGLRRLWADHVISRHWARKVDVVYFPKGWLPLILPSKTKCYCHLHDAITRYYLQRYPEYGGLRMRYFDFLTAHSLRHADRLFTGTHTSARALEQAYGSSKSLQVISTGSFRKAYPPRKKSSEAAFLVMGSTRPHKYIPQTLTLLNAYAERQGKILPVRMTGLDDFPVENYPHLNITLTGRLPTKALENEIASAKVLLYLSEVEGFGLPPLEAVELGTPVCYRNDSSVAEVMQNAPGGWDGVSEKSFFEALDAAMSMKDEMLSRLQTRLASVYRWDKVVGDFFTAFRDSGTEGEEPKRRRFGVLDLSLCGIPELLEELATALAHPHEGSCSICCVNAHIYNQAERDSGFRDLLNEADILAADGMSVVWAGHLFGLKIPGRCNMTDAFYAWLQQENFPEAKVILMGCSEEEVGAAGKRIEDLQPKCRVLATHHGYEGVEQLVDWVGKQGKADLILVGMGSPKSEQLIQRIKVNNAAPVIWHVGGGTLKFLAGTDVEAPGWMRKSGLQWLHRLMRNPRKMAGRYLWGNPLFVLRIFRRWAFPFRRKDHL